MAAQLQRTGETLFAAFFLLSVLQASVALYQYRYDLRGQLIFPEGDTLGTEDYYGDDNAVKTDHVMVDNYIDTQYQDAAVSSNITDTSYTATPTDKTTNSSWANQVVKKLNKSLFLLLPWLTQNVHNLLTKSTHMFHIAFIVFILDSLLPFILDDEDSEVAAGGNNVKKGDEKMDTNASSVKAGPGMPSFLKKISSHKGLSPSSTDKDPFRVLVIGDSLAIGTGCIEQFDATKDNSVPMALIENTAGSQPKSHRLQGPVFPQVLARTLSYHFQQPVQWRSAGVDGGDVNDIREFCMDVVKQECTKADATVDIVVVIFGMNDLKKILSVDLVNPIQHFFRKTGEETQDGGGTSQFRHGMEMLLSDIHSHAPDALVVFPALPIQPFHKNSIINVFPLGLIVDAVVGLWERQKKIVASRRRNTMYVELNAKEIADWYSLGSTMIGNAMDGLDNYDDFRSSDDFDDIKDDVLLSLDGVHPNKRLYAKWAELVGHKLYKHVVPHTGLLEEKDLSKETKNTQLKREAPATTKRTAFEHDMYE